MLVRPACLLSHFFRHCFDFLLLSLLGGTFFFSFVISSVPLILQPQAMELTWILPFYCSNTEVSKPVSLGCGHLGVACGLAGCRLQLCAAGLPRTESLMELTVSDRRETKHKLE